MEYATGKVQEAIYIVNSFRNNHFRELLDKNDLAHAKSCSGSKDLELRDPPHNFQRGDAETNFHYPVTTS